MEATAFFFSLKNLFSLCQVIVVMSRQARANIADDSRTQKTPLAKTLAAAPLARSCRRRRRRHRRHRLGYCRCCSSADARHRRSLCFAHALSRRFFLLPLPDREHKKRFFPLFVCARAQCRILDSKSAVDQKANFTHLQRARAHNLKLPTGDNVRVGAVISARLQRRRGGATRLDRRRRSPH